MRRPAELSIRMVVGYREVAETEEGVVAAARYVPNTQLLSMLFRSELIHYAA
jgi:hypothetical protein